LEQIGFVVPTTFGMKTPEQRELEQLQQRQVALQQQLDALTSDLRQLEAQLQLATPIPPIELTPVVPPPLLVTPPPTEELAIPPVIATVSQQAETVATESTFVPSAEKEFVPEFVHASPGPGPAADQPPGHIPPPPFPSDATSSASPASLEMRLGTYWLVRVGAVLILTGLTFFSNLAYQKMGAGGKIALLYLASGLLLGAGAWWQRKAAKASLQNFGQVLFAGGLAAVYFTTYAAHHIETLRVIQSALLDGILLFGWAGFIAWIADRRKSELLALFAIGLAYYTSAITPVGHFTLYSNLVLALAAVGFLVRNRWAGLSWASLLATYAAYAWWRFYHGDTGWRWATPDEGLGFGAAFLFAYWIIFTVAALVSNHENLGGPRRAAFITLNNGALFSLFVLTMLQTQADYFWQFCLGLGAGLLGLAEIARRGHPTETPTKNTYLTQGLVLVTIGFIAKFSGTQLALILGAESVMLFILGTLRKNIFLQTGSYLCGALSVSWGIDSLQRDDWGRLSLGAGLGGLMAFNGCWSARQRWWSDPRELRPEPTYFIFLALVMWIATTWYNTTTANFPLALAGEALLLTASIYVLRVRELTLLGQLLLFIAHLLWLARFVDSTLPPPWWNPLALIGITLALSHWWQKQNAITLNPAIGRIFQALYALALLVILHLWLEPHFTADGWIALTGLLALGVTCYAVLTRLWWLAAAAQLFLLLSCWAFANQLTLTKPTWCFPLTPIAVLLALSLGTVNWFCRHPEIKAEWRDGILLLATGYRWVALALTIFWVFKYVPERELPWTFALLGTLSFALAGWRRNREPLHFAAVLLFTGFIALWFLPSRAEVVYLPNFLVTLTPLLWQQVGRRQPTRYELPRPTPDFLILTGGGTLWWLVSQWVQLGAGGFYLTASWSVLALAFIGSGVCLRERTYRWTGLGILGVALGRIVLIDVWELETFYRVLSFMALGIVLVVLGFIYNKYQEKLREWL
jgi:uncharacterized membrane protein